MKTIFRFIKKYFGEILIVFGTGSFTYNFFDFAYHVRPSGIVYEYSSEGLIFIAVGVVCIVAGILVIRNRNN